MALKIQNGNYRNPPRKTDNGISGRYFAVGAKIVFLAVLFFLFFNAFTYLNHRTGKIVDEINRLEKEIKYTEREIENLRMKNARLKTFGHIKSKIDQFKLGLRTPSSGQVRQIVIAIPTPGSRDTSTMAIGRND